MKKILYILLTIICFSCDKKESKEILFTVQNTLDIDKSFETVEISEQILATIKSDFYKVIDIETKEEIISQTVDYNLDGINEVLLFQPKISANRTKTYKIIGVNTNKIQDSTLIRCYSRFVPERTDDYAWENNKVAFRTYGPTAQKMIEDSVKGGTLSSGIDAWLKRVEYPIINKWYKKHTSGIGSYHKDTGEGLDNFHVGASRGIGGIAVKTDSTYAFSKNFISSKTITSGPIRTSFILEYATWSANGKEIKETKHISLDYGQNLSRFEIHLSGTDSISAGITLHKQDGISKTNLNEGWMSYWEPFDDSELGLGLVAINTIKDFDKYITSKNDESNLYAQLTVANNTVVYYAGFGWKKNGQFNTQQQWDAYLSNFSKKLKTPLIIEFQK
ncbi:DUF4861 family protein [uncultured Winogradskyella sp.]|uniref:DUF4861 family protein n=1 Tax=uncultured Winogradskyella sp. TaxID=395353 RepID=UPI002625BB84|nr:DUF4861 family protein [uncultured Winogradskyella sp.]